MRTRTNTETITSFINGKCLKKGNLQSIGSALYYYGNKVAEWREDGLYISNGNYPGTKGETGSKTTKDILNNLPNVSLSQHKFQWYLNSKEWDGSWIKIEDVEKPIIDTEKQGNMFVTELKYVETSSWRGYEEPIYAIAGVNDTGSWSDSPCPSNIADKELSDIINVLKKHKISVKKITTSTSNVFCVHHYLIPKLKYVDKAREIVKEHLSKVDTMLIYACN
jgi:hypothetical protein